MKNYEKIEKKLQGISLIIDALNATVGCEDLQITNKSLGLPDNLDGVEDTSQLINNLELLGLVLDDIENNTSINSIVLQLVSLKTNLLKLHKELKQRDL